MDKAWLLREIAQDDMMYLVEDREGEVEAFDAEYSKTVVFRIAPHTTETLSERIRFGESLCSGKEREWSAHIASVLMHLDPELFFTLRYILVVGTIPDVEQLSTELSLDAEDIPCACYAPGSDTINTDCLGVLWFSESTVIVNEAAIKQAVLDMIDSGVAKAWEEDLEIARGFWSTLLHELRHQQVECCPYDAFCMSDGDVREARVECWASEQYDTLRAKMII